MNREIETVCEQHVLNSTNLRWKMFCSENKKEMCYSKSTRIYEETGEVKQERKVFCA